MRNRRSLWGIAIALVWACSAGGGASSGDVVRETGTGDVCGDGRCSQDEDCWSCPEDCTCRCGDGVCTHGEWCAVCPTDCHCEILAASPPMGWNTWNRFRCDLSEDLIRQTAEAMVASGMRDAGYLYVNLDDCWQVGRDELGRIVADPDRFPSGIAALADYVHALGMKLGIYTCAGTATCQERPGSYGFEFLDAETYAEWGVDYVKVDWCYTEGMKARERYSVFRQALDRAGRPMVFSICNWGLDSPWVWGPYTGHLWRTSMDIFDAWVSVVLNYELTVPWAAFAGPGHWNDPDMLEVGNGGMTNDEYRAHMSLWSILSAPLIAGHDVRTMDDETREILLNREVIAVDQDPLGLQGVRISTTSEGGQVLAKPLAFPGARAVVLFNPTEGPVEMTVRFADLGLADESVAVRDLWAGQDLGPFKTFYRTKVAGHGAVMLRLQGREHTPPSGLVFVSDLPWAYAANSRGPVERDRANGGEAPEDGPPLRTGGREYARGLGVHAASRVLFHTGGRCHRFLADVGLDESAGADGSVLFEVLGDGTSRFRTGIVRRDTPPISVDVDLHGVRFIELRVDAAGDDYVADVADWADARLQCGQ